MNKLHKIAIDINEANVSNRVGTGQYSYHILKRLKELSPETEFHLYHRDALLPHLPPADQKWIYHQVSPARGWLNIGLPLNLLISRAKYDCFWSPAHYTPSYIGSPSVVTIHDLAYEYFPDLFLPSDLYKLKNWSRRAVSRASLVIAVSEATKQDLIKLYGTDPAKITVIHNGYDSDIFNMTTHVNAAIIENYKLEIKNYILFLGTIQPRKNVIKLVQAFHLLKESGYNGKLVIAGSIGWLADDSLDVIKNSPDVADIVMTGYISDEARLALYRNAEVYCLPSLYEGFGVPAIEAMAAGAPVAVANNSSLPEVVGDAGVLFDERNPASIAEGINKILSDRSVWVKKSLARAQNFSWDKCAKETLNVISGNYNND